MSRARELAKVGGKNQQVLAGLSSHVGVSTFLNNVHMFANLDVGGNVTVTGTTTFNGGTLTLGDANTDNIVFGGEVDSNIIPDDDGSYDLGSSSKEWKDLFIDGTAHIDTLDVDENAGIIGNLTLTGNADFNGNLDVDGTTDLDATNVVGTLTVTGDIAADNVTVNGNTVSTSSGNLTLDSSGGTVAVADNITVSGNGSVTGTFDVDGATTLDGLTVAEGATFSSTLGVTGTTTLSGALVANGNVDLGNATSDTITATGRFDSDLLPSTDGARDLGSSTLEWQDLFIDGTANIDSLVADTADINGGSIDGTTIGSASATTAAFTTISASGNVDFNGDLDVDGTANLDVVDIDGAVDMASTLTLAGNADFNAALDVDGHTNLDNVSVAGVSTFASGVTITGALDANGGASIDNVQVGVTNDNEIDTSSGNLVIDSAGGTVTVDDNLTVSGNLTVNGTTTTINSTTVSIDDKNFQVATGAADDAAADGAGLTVDSGDGDKTFNFEATGDNWGASENLNLASGKVYKINNSSILSATTLGSSVVSSSLTSVGTITSGVWNGTAIANANLANSTVSYGGISLALGASDATPAFDLSDATNYPTSSLSGTITNAQLAGSIANSKLANSTISLGGITLSLGGTDATPAFNLSDATNYPTSSLSGTITNAQLAGSIADSKLSTISTANKVSLSALNIDGGTDIGAALVDADEIIVDDGGGGTNRRSDLSRVKTYIYGAMSGDATASSAGAVTLASTGVSAGTVGSSTAIPIITVDAKGRITSTSTTAIDSTTIENGTASVAVASNGPITSTGNHDFTAGIDVTGNITVSGTVDGRDVASDGSKLDGIESGATADQTASEILTLIKTVDGAGSGLDADTLDGISSGSFLRSDTADTITATLTARAITPQSDSTYDLGTNSVRWANVYADDVRTGDLHLSNEHRGGNTIDGSWGHYQIEEGSDDLFLKNRRTGKTYKFMLQEV